MPHVSFFQLHSPDYLNRIEVKEGQTLGGKKQLSRHHLQRLSLVYFGLWAVNQDLRAAKSPRQTRAQFDRPRPEVNSRN